MSINRLTNWRLIGYFVGAGTALLGKEGAMACTVAVESVIGEHYNRYQSNLTLSIIKIDINSQLLTQIPPI